MKNSLNKLVSLVLLLLILISSFSCAFVCTAYADEVSLPDFVDNSESKYFPAIGNQGSQGSCCCWAQVYYQFTYMMNRSMDVKTTPENTFSHTFIYNFANGGRGQGTWEDDVYELMKEIGNVPLSTVPHNIEDYNNWHATEEIWQEAMKYRVDDYTIFKDIGQAESQITSPDDSGLNNIKTLLAEGEVLAATTYIYSWDVERIKANASAPENDKYIDEYIIRLSDGAGDRHRVTIVGYNDNIWTDVNENNKVDSGEMGAFKIANSWGTDHHNKGYMWVAYDAINRTSSVSGCPAVDYRPEALNDITQITVIPYDTDTDLYLRYTLNTCDRSQGKIYVTAEKDGVKTTFEVGPKKKHGMQNSTYSYDGTTNTNDGTMVWALRSIVPEITAENIHEYSFSVKFEDTNADGKRFTVKNMEIVDDSTGRISKPVGVYPFSLDGSEKTISFPQFEECIPVTTTASETTSQAITTEAVTTEAAETSIVSSTDLIPAETTVITEPYETTVEVITTFSTESIETTVNNHETTMVSEATTETAIFETTVPEVAVYLYGDANNDNSVKINDATLIQKFVAFLVDADSLNLISVDCNGDLKVSVKDATCIQKYLAKLSDFAFAGSEYYVELTYPAETTEIFTESTEEVSEFTDPIEITTIPETTASATEPVKTDTTVITQVTTSLTEVTTELITTTSAQDTIYTSEATTVSEVIVTQPATMATYKVTFTNSFGWQGQISCYYWSDTNQSMTSWPGVPMTNDGTNDFGETLYTLQIPKDAAYIIFTNGSVQTVDIPYDGGWQRFYPVSANSDGKYTVNTW